MKRLTLFFTVALALVCYVSTAFAMEFSADTMFTSKGMVSKGKMYAKEKKVRMEMSSPQEMITISRMDKNVAWTIMVSEKMYLEVPFNPNQIPKTEVQGEIDRKLIGSESVNGHPSKKYLVTYTSMGKTVQMYQWMATDINFPVRSADVNGDWTQDFLNVKIGSQPDHLFELPKGYEKMEMPVMPGMPGGMRYR